MKKPIYNEVERYEMRNFDCALTAFRKLNIAVLHIKRAIDREMLPILNKINSQLEKLRND